MLYAVKKVTEEKIVARWRWLVKGKKVCVLFLTIGQKQNANKIYILQYNTN